MPKNLNSSNLSEKYAAIVSFDWADSVHVAATLAAPLTGKPEISKIHNKPEDLCEWVAKMQSLYPGKRIAVALEQRKGHLIHFLSAFEFIDIFPVEPVTINNYRKAIYPSGAKSDPIDAELILEFVLKHPEKICVWKPHSENIRKLAQFCEDRRIRVDARARLIQSLTSSLKLYFPLALELFEDLSTPLACEFLQKWSTLEELKRAKPATLRAFFYRHGSRSTKLIEERLKKIEKAVALTKELALLDVMSLRIQSLIAEIKTLNTLIDKYDERIAEVFAAVDRDGVFRSFPGAGPQLGPRLAAVFGDDMTRYDDSSDVQRFTGAAPVTRASGKKRVTNMRWACGTFPRQTAVEFAASSVIFCPWAKAFYELHMPKDKEARAKARYTVLRKLAFKWLRIIFRCWKTNTPYNDAKYLDSLKKANSPVWHKLQDLKAAA